MPGKTEDATGVSAQNGSNRKIDAYCTGGRYKHRIEQRRSWHLKKPSEYPTYPESASPLLNGAGLNCQILIIDNNAGWHAEEKKKYQKNRKF